MWIDCHCHVEQLPSPEKSIQEAQEVGVSKICAVSETLDGMSKILELRTHFPSTIVVGLGLHPRYFDDFSDPVIAQALDFISANRESISMMGEIGIDYKFATTELQKEKQMILLNRQLDLSAKLKLPINLHSRRAEKQTVGVAIEYHTKTKCNAVLHWFTQSRQLVRRATKGGVFVSVGPSVIYDEKTQQVVKEIDLKYMLLESDGPVEHPHLADLGTLAEPKWIPKIGSKVAELFYISESHLQEVLMHNFERYINNL